MSHPQIAARLPKVFQEAVAHQFMGFHTQRDHDCRKPDMLHTWLLARLKMA